MAFSDSPYAMFGSKPEANRGHGRHRLQRRDPIENSNFVPVRRGERHLPYDRGPRRDGCISYYTQPMTTETRRGPEPPDISEKGGMKGGQPQRADTRLF